VSAQKTIGVAVLFSRCQRSQKIVPVHAILECLPTINENYWNLISVLLLQFGARVDVHLTPAEGFALNLGDRLFHYFAEMTSLPRIHHHIVHVEIVNVSERRP